MKILGIDHATVHAGVSLFENDTFSILRAVDLSTFPYVSPMRALHGITRNLICAHAPNFVALERPMALRNGDVARKLIEVYAGVKLAAELEDVPVIEVTPQLAKMYTASHGQAEKDDVARALEARFGLQYDEIAVPVYFKDKKRKGQVRERRYDVSDACALCVAAWEIKRKEAASDVVAANVT